MNTSPRSVNLNPQAQEIFRLMYQRVDPPDVHLGPLNNFLWLFPGLLVFLLMGSRFSSSSLLFSVISYGGFASYVFVACIKINRLMASDSEIRDVDKLLVTILYVFYSGLILFFLAIIFLAMSISMADGLPDALRNGFQSLALASTVVVVAVVFVLGPRIYKPLFGYGAAGASNRYSRGVIVAPLGILLVTVLRIAAPATVPYLSIPCLLGTLLLLVVAVAMLDQAWVLWLAGARNIVENQQP